MLVWFNTSSHLSKVMSVLAVTATTLPLPESFVTFFCWQLRGSSFLNIIYLFLPCVCVEGNFISRMDYTRQGPEQQRKISTHANRCAFISFPPHRGRTIFSCIGKIINYSTAFQCRIIFLWCGNSRFKVLLYLVQSRNLNFILIHYRWEL